jgi:gamma-glutamyl phosphate reductase
MSNNIQNCENKEVEFLRIKNAQLEEKNSRLENLVKELEDNKVQILAINSKYVDVVNRYYEEQNTRAERDKSLGARKVRDPANMSSS